MKSVLISIKPRWCEKIVSGEKTIEVRKTRPKLDAPFKCYIYCTLDNAARQPNKYIWKTRSDGFQYYWNGKVIGEFVCWNIDTITATDFVVHEDAINALDGSCLTIEAAKKYAGWKRGDPIYLCKDIYGWNISDLKIYDNPKELSDFKPLNRKCYYSDLGLAKPDCEKCHDCNIKRPPQSWCYVEGE